MMVKKKIKKMFSDNIISIHNIFIVIHFNKDSCSQEDNT